ncbi:helix-turn-helix transcriptional regulator [Rhizobium laguerreae]|uniref:helix-turn-helix domain-containing protein n=1 Tax=Rhizobium laguerreae TaxID=1076926 RepID=UPI001C9188F6|nr:helix-turn-helix domain-containing protein [Rhizobium laguerreae]MBY3332508.1 helix-turn-helix transcriptional regulator [Rhizobium laguerreae]
MEHDLADRIRSRLEHLEKSAASASLEAGLGRSAITDILSGNTGSPRVSTIEKLAPVLETSVSYLLGIQDDPAKEDLAPRSDPAPERNGPLMATAAVGVFQEDGVFFANSKKDKDAYFARGLPEYPDWQPWAVKMADSSMGLEYIFQDDILTVIVPPGSPPESIPLQTGMIVLIKRRVQHEGIFEISVRYVRAVGREIHFETRPEEALELRCVTVKLSEIGDTGFEGDPNQYPTSDGRIRIVGIVIKAERSFPLPI